MHLAGRLRVSFEQADRKSARDCLTVFCLRLRLSRGSSQTSGNEETKTDWRMHFTEIILWLFVINLGVAFGAGIYESDRTEC